MGANFGDIDNDGYLDVYLTTGDPAYETLMPNVMLRNEQGRRFADVTFSGGFGHLQKGHGVAFADFDHDGDLDIYHQLGGFYPGDRFRNALFRNPGHGRHFLAVELVGVRSNRRGVGARIRAKGTGDAEGGWVHRAVGSVSSFGGSPLREHIGVAGSTRVDRLEVTWPASSTTQVFTNLPADHLVIVTEGKDDIEVRALPGPVALGGDAKQGLN
jgi:hypothetical protein